LSWINTLKSQKRKVGCWVFQKKLDVGEMRPKTSPHLKASYHGDAIALEEGNEAAETKVRRNLCIHNTSRGQRHPRDSKQCLEPNELFMKKCELSEG
jgi:hypothetical protein